MKFSNKTKSILDIEVTCTLKELLVTKMLDTKIRETSIIDLLQTNEDCIQDISTTLERLLIQYLKQELVLTDEEIISHIKDYDEEYLNSY